jgi:hypothetical protein
MEKRRYHIVIASILFALLVWISVNLRDEFTIVKQFPIVLENIREGKALKYPLPRNINVRFKGNGWSLAGLYLMPDMKYIIDLSTIGPEDFAITGRELSEHIKLPESLRPLDVIPDTMVLALDDYKEKRVPIVLNLMVSYKEGYGRVGAINIVPESVLVGGSRNLMEHISSWLTNFTRFDQLHLPIDADIRLEEPATYSLTLLNHSARLKIDVQPFAEKTFTGIPVSALSTPPNREVIFIPPRMDIIVRGGIEQLAKLSNEDFKAALNYQALVQDSVESVVPILTSPAEIKVINKKPERFQYIIRKKL